MGKTRKEKITIFVRGGGTSNALLCWTSIRLAYERCIG